MKKLLLATNNAGKIKELRALLQGIKAEILTPNELGLELDVMESGDTYLENAAKKAIVFAKASGMLSLADDSGLEVAALDGAPGIYSARYSPKEGANDKDRREYLLEQLQSKPRPWMARFHCTVVLATPTGETQSSEGDCKGEIIPQERGTGGFGYDPIFLVSGMRRTMAELSMSEKNRLSHRARAIQSIWPVLVESL